MDDDKEQPRKPLDGFDSNEDDDDDDNEPLIRKKSKLTPSKLKNGVTCTELSIDYIFKPNI